MATSGTFGTVQTADNTEVTQWQWEASINSGESWAEAQLLLSDVSGQGTQTLTVESALLSEDGTLVRCRAYYSGGSTLSNEATLKVNPV